MFAGKDLHGLGAIVPVLDRLEQCRHIRGGAEHGQPGTETTNRVT
jgi:hypothetical protein